MSLLPLSMILGFVVPPSAGFLSAAKSQHHAARYPEPPMPTSTRIIDSKVTSSALFMEVDTVLISQLVVGATLATVTDPLEEMVFNKTAVLRGDDETDNDLQAAFWYGAADSITVAARTYLVVLIGGVATQVFDWNLPIEADLREAAPAVAVTVWVALTLCTIKQTLFSRLIEGRNLGRIKLYDRLLDFVVAIGATAFLVDELKIDAGMGMQSLLAGSGVGALAFSLASKDLAQHIVGGLTVQAWDAFDVGDDILLGDGTAGTITKIGLVETELVGYDNVPIRIPNSQLASERVSNMSRIKLSRVYQNLRFEYSDLDILPDLLNDIKEEITASCPKLILDGSKPFQALLSAYETDHVEAYVNCHFVIPPGTDEFVNNRQQVLLAIARALKKNGVKIALPAIVYETKDPKIL